MSVKEVELLVVLTALMVLLALFFVSLGGVIDDTARAFSREAKNEEDGNHIQR